MKPAPPDFSSNFQKAIADWRKRHAIRDDDMILLCLSVVSLVLACAALLADVAAIRFATPPLSLVFAAGCLAFSGYALLVPERAQKIVACLKGLRWKRSEFCRGWLITGDTGSGKTTYATCRPKTSQSLGII